MQYSNEAVACPENECWRYYSKSLNFCGCVLESDLTLKRDLKLLDGVF